MKRERWKNASTKGESYDQEFGRQCWASAQIHEAHSMEVSTDLQERRRECQAVGPL